MTEKGEIKSEWYGKDRRPTPEGMTRNQFKKMLKTQAWQEKKDSYKQAKKVTKQARKKEKKEEGGENRSQKRLVEMKIIYE